MDRDHALLRFFLAALIFGGCAPSARAHPAEQGGPPRAVLDAAVQAVQAQVGDSFYAALVTPRPEWTEFHPALPQCGPGCLWPWQTPYFVVFFTFQPDRSDLPGRLIVVVIDTAALPIQGFPPVGAPLCAADPAECSFPISSDSAATIARLVGLPAGVAPWTREFLWLAQPRVGACGRCTGYFTSTAADERSTYGWKVRAVTRVWAGGAEGETLYIDANSGRVLDRARWSIVQ